MIVAIQGVKRVFRLDFTIFEEGICEVEVIEFVLVNGRGSDLKGFC